MFFFNLVQEILPEIEEMKRNCENESVKNNLFYKAYKSNLAFVEKFSNALKGNKTKTALKKTEMTIQKSYKTENHDDKQPSNKLTIYHENETLNDLKNHNEIQKNEISHLHRILDKMTRELEFKFENSNSKRKINDFENSSSSFRVHEETSYFNKSILNQKRQTPHLGDEEILGEDLDQSDFKNDFENVIWESNRKSILWVKENEFEMKFEKEITKTPHLFSIICNLKNKSDSNLNEINFSISNSEGIIKIKINFK